MSTALSTMANKLADKLGMEAGEQLVPVLKATAFSGDATDAQFVALLVVANQYGLNPFTKEIYAFPDKQNGIVPVVGVDGWARIINGHPQFDGMDFEQNAESCTCRIYRKDRNHPISVTEWMDECRREAFKSKSGYEVKGPWQSHPKRMLRHKAMIQCARLAFGFAGIYDKDEAERVIEGTTAEVNAGKQSDDRRPELISKAEESARFGAASYEKFWTGLTQEEKQIIGTADKKRIYQISKDADNTVEGELVNQEVA